MGIRVTVSSVKGNNSIFHKLSYYGPNIAHRIDGFLYVVDLVSGKTLAIIKDWVYLENIENCEQNRKQYKEPVNETQVS